MASVEILVLISGPVAVGKTALRQELIAVHEFDYVRSGSYLLARAEQQGIASCRTDLQNLGDALDRQTDYRWLLDDVALPGFAKVPEQRRWLVDAVRKARQIEHFRAEFGSAVLHVHLTASEDILRNRYERRRLESGVIYDKTPYETAISHENEIASRSLISLADIVIDTGHNAANDAANHVRDAAFRKCND